MIALYGLKHAPRLWPNSSHPFWLSLEFQHSLADANLNLLSDDILKVLYIDNIRLLCPEDGTKAGIEVKIRLSVQYNITLLSPARQFLGVKIHLVDNSTCTRTGTASSLSQNPFITTIPKRFNMQKAQGASTSMSAITKTDLA